MKRRHAALVKFNTEINDAIVLETAKSAGLSVIPTTSYYCEQAAPKEFLIAFVMLEEEEMTGRLERWASLLRA